MRHKRLLMSIPLLVLLVFSSMAGVFADWAYGGPPTEVDSSLSTSMGSFTYGKIYITSLAVTGGSATANKTGETTMTAQLAPGQTATITVSFFNSTAFSYYYKETEATALDAGLTFAVSGLERDGRVQPNTRCELTLTVTCAATAAADLSCALNFVFSTAKDPSGLFITSTELYGTPTDLESQAISHVDYSTTVECALDKANRNNVTGTAAYRITVLNNTDRIYSYRGLYYQTSQDANFDSATYNGNEYISESAGNSKISIAVEFEGASSLIQPGESMTFTVTYTVGRNLDRNTNWKTLVNLQFGINVDSADEALDAVADKFADVLNTSVTYQQILDQIDNKYDGRGWTATFFGNVTGSTDSDSVAINTLFAGQLNMVIGGVEQPVTVIIKRENIDGNYNTGDDYTVTNGTSTASGRGCEYTLYMTTDALATSNAYPTVYAMVYTCDRDADGNLGDWYMLGQLYEGAAQVVGYMGNTENSTSGSFDTGSWRSRTQTLSPTESYTYTIGQNYSISTIITAKDSTANNTLQSLLNEAYRILTENKYAGTGMVDLENAYAASSGIYTLDSGGPLVADVSRAKLVPYIQKMDRALQVFQLSELEALAKLAHGVLNSTGGTQEERAALQSAYDNAKNANLFTDIGGVIAVNESASHTLLQSHVSVLLSACQPFMAE